MNQRKSVLLGVQLSYYLLDPELHRDWPDRAANQPPRTEKRVCGPGFIREITESDAHPGETLPPEHKSGLDALRALAISLVFVYHWRVFVGPAPALGWLGEVGWTGVDLWGVAHQGLYIDGYGYGGFMTIAGYSLMALAFALLVLAAHSPASGLMQLRLPGAATLARWSYCLYLSHKAVAHLMQVPLAQAGVSPWAGFAWTALAALAVAALLHHAVEVPGLALRARWFPSSSRSPR